MTIGISGCPGAGKSTLAVALTYILHSKSVQLITEPTWSEYTVQTYLQSAKRHAKLFDGSKKITIFDPAIFLFHIYSRKIINRIDRAEMAMYLGLQHLAFLDSNEYNNSGRVLFHIVGDESAPVELAIQNFLYRILYIPIISASPEGRLREVMSHLSITSSGMRAACEFAKEYVYGSRKLLP